MPPETKAITDYQNILSTEMDVQEAFSDGRLDGFAIRNVVFQRTSFENRHFSNVLMHRVGMQNANGEGFVANAVQCTESALRGCLMRYSEFDSFNMSNCEAMEIDLSEALIQNSGFFDSMMSNARFIKSKLVKTAFRGGSFYGGDFENAFLAQCEFSDPKRECAEMSRVNFKRAMIIDSTLKQANLFAANFTDAILVRVDMRGVNLAHADMRGAVLIDCRISTDDAAGAIWK